MPVDEILTVGIDLDIRQALQQTKKFQQEMTKAMGQIGKMADKMAKANVKAAKAAAQGTKEQVKGYNDLGDSIGDAMKAGAKKGGKSPWIDQKALAKEAGAGLSLAAEGFKGMVSSNLKEIIGSSAKALRGSLNVAVKGVAAGAMKRGSKWSEMGAKMGARGKKQPGAGGAAMRAGGAGLKAAGKVSSGMGKALGAVAKIGPLLGVAVTAMVKLVSLFIDADSQAKAFQKSLLQADSTIEFMGANAWDAKKAFGDLSYQVKEIRNAAHDWANDEWGLKAEDHLAVITTLQQEGVGIRRITEEAQEAGTAIGTMAAQLTHMSVAYSKAFGQPLAEIAKLQGEMLTDLGMGIGETNLAFAKMARSASESGMAANKFFQIIRGASQDMSLYNMRMGDAVKTLKLLSNVMNPRNAQKFFQTTIQGLKNMGREQLLQLSLLVGHETLSKIVEKNLQGKYKVLGKKLGMDAGEVAQTLSTQGVKGLEDKIKTLPEKAQAAVREMAIETQSMQTQASKGEWGTAQAARNLGPAGANEVLRKALQKFGGTGDMREDQGSLAFDKATALMNLSAEDVQDQIKWLEGMDREREDMKTLLKKSYLGDKLTAAETEKLTALQEAGLRSVEDVTAAGDQDIYEAMTETDEQAQTDAEEAHNYAKQQVDLTRSWTDRLETLIEFIMNQLYEVFLDLWKMVAGSKLFGSDESRRKQEKAEAAKGVKGAAAKELMGIAGGENFTGAMAGSDVNQALVKALNDLAMISDPTRSKGQLEQIRTLKDALRDPAIMASLSPKEQKETQARYDALTTQRREEKKQAAAILKMQEGQFGSMSNTMVGQLTTMATGKSKGLQEEVDIGGVKSTRAEYLQKMLTAGMSQEESFEKAGITDEMKRDMLKELAWMPENMEGGGAAMVSRMGGIGQELEGAGYQVTAAEDAALETASATEQLAESTADNPERAAKAAEDMYNASQGHTLSVKFPESFLSSKYKKTVEEAVLSAVRQALFEYYIYSESIDPMTLVQMMANEGMTAESMARGAGQHATRGTLPGDIWSTGVAQEMPQPEPDNRQLGGPTRGGLTMLHGQEFVVPAHGAPVRGGGGGGDRRVVVEFRGDAGRLFQQATMNTVYDARRRERGG